MTDELDQVLDAIYAQGFDNAAYVAGKPQPKFGLTKPEAKAELVAWRDREVISELQKLESLPNVYPEKIKGQYTHVEAIYKSAIADRIKQLSAKGEKDE